MGEYRIKSGFITDQTDFQLATAGIAYEIEKANIHHVGKFDIKTQIDKLRETNKFPSNLDYVDSFYDQKSGLFRFNITFIFKKGSPTCLIRDPFLYLS